MAETMAANPITEKATSCVWQVDRRVATTDSIQEEQAEKGTLTR